MDTRLLLTVVMMPCVHDRSHRNAFGCVFANGARRGSPAAVCNEELTAARNRDIDLSSRDEIIASIHSHPSEQEFVLCSSVRG